MLLHLIVKMSWVLVKNVIGSCTIASTQLDLTDSGPINSCNLFLITDLKTGRLNSYICKKRGNGNYLGYKINTGSQITVRAKRNTRSQKKNKTFLFGKPAQHGF